MLDRVGGIQPLDLEEPAHDAREPRLVGRDDSDGLVLTVLGALGAVVLDEEVHLDPEQLAKGLDGLVLGLLRHVQRVDTANEQSLDVTEQSIAVNEVD